jgi:hypothetical protein
MYRVAAIAAGILVATSASAFAHTPTHSEIEAREQRQLGEIEQGRQTGAITWTEGLKLRAEQRRIKQIEEAYEADGHVSTAERRSLHTLQDEARQDIVREQNDGWHRVWWMPRFGR